MRVLLVLLDVGILLFGQDLPVNGRELAIGYPLSRVQLRSGTAQRWLYEPDASQRFCSTNHYLVVQCTLSSLYSATGG